MKRAIVPLLVLMSFCASVFAQGPTLIPVAASAPNSVMDADPFADVDGTPMSQAEMEETEGGVVVWLYWLVQGAGALIKAAPAIISTVGSILGIISFVQNCNGN